MISKYSANYNNCGKLYYNSRKEAKRASKKIQKLKKICQQLKKGSLS